MDYEESTNNKVTLMGKIVDEPRFSHEVYGEGFYEFTLCVPRLSGQTDLLPITVSERLMSGFDMSIGREIVVQGQFRSYNKLDETKSKLMLTVFARSLDEAQADINPNTIELCGYICKKPMYRTTPFKREISDLLIAVNRAYNKSDYIPCIAWGRNARYVNTLAVGSRIRIFGRIQSRTYQKVNEENIVETRTAYEVSVSGIKNDFSNDDEILIKKIG